MGGAPPPQPDRPSAAQVSRHLISGTSWMVAMRWSIKAIGLISTMILARLLTPADFGLVGKAMLLIGLIEVLSETGQRLALIHHPDPSPEHYDTAWTISIIVGLLIGAAVFLSAPAARLYFDEPAAVPLVQVLALRCLLLGLENIYTIDFRRNLDFATEFRYGVYRKIVSFVATLVLALIFRNALALVGGILAGHLISLVLSYTMHPKRARLGLSKFRDLWGYSSWSLVNTMAHYLQVRFDQVLVAGAADAAAMGRYSVGAELATLPSTEIIEPMGRALFPVYAKLNHDRAQLCRTFLAVLGMLAMISFSCAVGIALVAEDLVQVVLGDQWRDAAQYVAVIALAAGLNALNMSVHAVFNATGQVRRAAGQSWTRLAVIVPCLYAGLQIDGVLGVAQAMLVAAVLLTPSYVYNVMQVIPLTLKGLLAVVWRPFVAAAAMAIAFALVPVTGLDLPPVARLPLSVGFGASVFAASVLLLWLASGRPDGAERAVLGKGRDLLRRAMPQLTPSN